MTKPDSVTVKNLEAAFAGESMAHMKYLHFARICREQGDEATAKVFEETAAQEIQHALGHAELLFPREKLGVKEVLRYAIEGETYDYTEMYPKFRHAAVEEGNSAAAAEFDEQIGESKDHAGLFKRTLEIAAKRFAALAKVEEKHAKRYEATLSAVGGK
ncbi:MAG TPA: rubrerythrin family protein [Turneriella sp.]|nr:rubrerythrin family protein [Turneriella sp.]HNE20190.1 rubrerythrin family protein [Turneriella sp.]HNL12181.1 rubrerythrin family protein [Turneriella sp.]HNN01737.1 rubrerythrin family protein [Turneriella sp.]